MRKNSPKQMNNFYDLYFEKYDIILVKNILKKKLRRSKKSRIRKKRRR